MNEKSIIESFDYTVNEYKTSLKMYSSSNPKVKAFINILNLFIQGMNNNQIFPIKYNKKISENYLKIISNIYFLNLSKVQKSFKNEYLDTGKLIQNPREIIDKLYKATLNESRNQVIEFFKLQKHEVFEISIKTLLRIYPYYLEKTKSIRIEYEKITEHINMIITKMNEKQVFDLLLNGDLEVKDEIREFESMVDSEEIKRSKEMKKVENEKILEMYRKKYGKKSSEVANTGNNMSNIIQVD